jgi:ComF family protein
MLKSLVSLFYVAQCHACGKKLSEGEDFLCGECVSRLPRTHYHTIPLNLMEQRFAGQVPFERATAYCFYNRGSALTQIFQDFKYRGYEGLARYMGRLAAYDLRLSGFFDGVDALVPIPMHYFKRARRGYNQTEAICRGISDELGIPVDKSLKAVRRHKTQTALTMEERKRNISGIFRFLPKENPSGRHLLIVDDVCTTGTTMLEAAKSIKSAYPEVKISFFSIGVTV